MTPDQLTFGFFYNLDRALASLMGAPYDVADALTAARKGIR